MGLYNTVVTLEENGIAAWAVDGSQNCKLKKRKSFADSGRLRAIDWDPHGSEFVAVAAEQSVFGFDFRADTISYSLKGVSRSGLSTLKFNPARQHVLALGHLDGTISFYDVRNAAKPLMQLHGHSHWVTQIAFNTFHDSYVLTAGTDAILNLWRLHSVSAEYEREKEKEKEKEKEREKEGGIERTPSKRALMAEREREKDKDFLVRRGTEHENPVCSVAWSTHSPWCWASMSTDGRILFHKMPQEERSRSFA
jgi:WD40 repeat protein